MSDKTQNDWNVIQDAIEGKDDALVALQRLREVTEVTIAGLNQRIRDLEDEAGGWPIPEEIRRA